MVYFYYNDVNLLGTSSTPPYTYTAYSVPAGTYTVTAKATDTRGVSTTSSPITVVVNPPPQTSTTSTQTTTTTTVPGDNSTTTSSTPTTSNSQTTTPDTSTTTTGSTTTTSNTTSTGTQPTPPSSPTTTTNTQTTTSNTQTTTGSSNPTPTVIGTPVVAITSPSSQSVFPEASDITVTAQASETNGTIAKVDFYSQGTLLDTSTKAPYTFTAHNVPAGIYTVTAQATDLFGHTATSSPISVIVTARIPTVNSPVVSITYPTDQSIIKAGSDVTITAIASETNGAISKVDFYYGINLLGTSTNPPYSYTVRNVPAGTYGVTARATDSNGVTADSRVVTVYVQTPKPTTNLLTNAAGILLSGSRNTSSTSVIISDTSTNSGSSSLTNSQSSTSSNPTQSWYPWQNN